MTDPITLYHRRDDGTYKALAHACGKCRTVAASIAQFSGDDAEQLSEESAREHCGPWYCACGDERSRFSAVCDQCRRQESAEREATRERERLAKAKRVEIDDVEGEYFYDGGDYLDRDTLLDKIEEGGAPSYVWACTSRGVEIDAEDVLDSALSDHYEDAADGLERGAVMALQVALDEWIRAFASRVRSYEPDFSRVVIVDEDRDDD